MTTFQVKANILEELWKRRGWRNLSTTRTKGLYLLKCVWLNVWKMFNIYEKEGEPMLEYAKLWFLLDCIQHSSLQVEVEALKANIATGTQVTYTTAAASQFADYVAKARVVGAVGTRTSNAGITDSCGNSINNNNNNNNIHIYYLECRACLDLHTC